MNSKMLDLFGDEALPFEKRDVKPVPKKGKQAPENVLTKDPLAGWKAQKHYYSIGEVAALFDVNTSAIRFWTIEFKLKVRTTRKGDRLYTEGQIQELRNIYHLLKTKGHKTSAAKEILKEKKVTPADTLDLKYNLLKLRNLLVQVSNNLASK